MSSYCSRRSVSMPAVASLLALAGLPMVALADPPTPQLLDVTTDMTLADDWYGSVVIATPNVRLDCAGHAIIGPGFDNCGEEFGGIQVEPETGDGTPVTNVTVKNCDIVSHVGARP
jgi:hypothetical protein